MSDPTKVPADLLPNLRQLKIKATLLQAELQKVGSQYQYEIVRALTDAGRPVETSIICLDCGLIRSKTEPQCSECQKGANSGKAASKVRPGKRGPAGL